MESRARRIGSTPRSARGNLLKTCPKTLKCVRKPKSARGK